MGEYATRKRDGERVKIGTCEDMYYMRFDQRHKVRAESSNVDPVKDAAEIRFRFPFPDEDDIEVGAFDGDYQRGVVVRGLDSGADVEHYTVQFKADGGYLLSLPCPESGKSLFPVMRSGQPAPAKDTPVIHLNGYHGYPQLTAQRYRPGIGLVPVMKCGGCGAMWRIEGREDIEALAVAIRAQADEEKRNQSGYASFLHTCADRVLAGILEPVTP